MDRPAVLAADLEYVVRKAQAHPNPVRLSGTRLAYQERLDRALFNGGMAGYMAGPAYFEEDGHVRPEDQRRILLATFLLHSNGVAWVALLPDLALWLNGWASLTALIFEGNRLNSLGKLGLVLGIHLLGRWFFHWTSRRDDQLAAFIVSKEAAQWRIERDWEPVLGRWSMAPRRVDRIKQLDN